MERFDDIILSSEIVHTVVSFCMNIFLGVFLLLVVYSIMRKCMKKEEWFMIPIKWYLNLPKLFISFFATILVFCFDYDKKRVVMFHYYDMTAATFFVGILAIIEIVSIIVSVIEDIISFTKKK